MECCNFCRRRFFRLGDIAQTKTVMPVRRNLKCFTTANPLSGLPVHGKTVCIRRVGKLSVCHASRIRQRDRKEDVGAPRPPAASGNIFSEKKITATGAQKRQVRHFIIDKNTGPVEVPLCPPVRYAARGRLRCLICRNNDFPSNAHKIIHR